MNKLEILNSYNALILQTYQQEEIKCLRGEKEDDYILNGKEILTWHSNTCSKITDENFNAFENIDNLLMCSDEIMFFTANLFLIKDFLNKPVLVKIGAKETFSFEQGLADKRFNMYCSIIFEKLYMFWSQIAQILKSYYIPDLENYKINFSIVMDKIRDKSNSANMAWLISFKENGYKTFNSKRKDIVHNKSFDTMLKYELIKSLDSPHIIDELIQYRDGLPDYFKNEIVNSLIGFEKTLNLINE